VPDKNEDLSGTCRACGQVVSRDAFPNVCPKCGEEEPAMTKEEYIAYTGHDLSWWGSIKALGSFFVYLTIFILQAIVGS